MNLIHEIGFKGQSKGNHGFPSQNDRVPVTLPLIQFWDL